MRWRCLQAVFEFPRPALILGVVNVTPDSFSDGGRFLDPERAVAHGLALAAEGADLLDVGGESTRPGAEPVPEAEERRRVLPVIRALAARAGVPVSVDTMKPAVAAAALEAGAAVINDVAAVAAGPAMARLVAASGAGYLAMHMQGAPRTMQAAPAYGDVVADLRGALGALLARLAAAGVAPEQVALDPGVGFGKTPEHNLALVARLAELAPLGRPLALGVSRKSFLGRVAGADVPARLPAALACSVLARAGGAAIFRTHDVAATRQALTMADALLHARKP
jgi:dihydropteroate synthase